MAQISKEDISQIIKEVCKERGYTIMKWIPIDEQMPDNCGMPLLLAGVNGYGQTAVFQGFTGYMEHGTLNFFSNTRTIRIENYDITHWMLLPAYPEGEKP